MVVKELLKEALELINAISFNEDNKNRLKDILCFLSEWRKNNTSQTENYPQLDFILYNASRKLRTFGYNRLNNFINEGINAGDDLSLLRDNVINELYKTKSGFILDKAFPGL